MESYRKPEYVLLPQVGKQASRIFFGTAVGPMLMGNRVDALLDSMTECGINAFDTARGYGNAENALGAWVKERQNRENIVILSKCGNVHQGKVCVNREVITRELHQSLAALQTEYIDIYLLHRDDPKTPVSEVIDTLNEMYAAGKIRSFGVSNWTHTRIAEANAYAEQNGLVGFTVSSPNYGLAQQVADPWGGACVTISGSENVQARAWYAANQMPVVAYSSLGRGFFSGRFRSGDWEGARALLDDAGQKGYLYPVNMERLRRAEELAKRDGCTVSQIAMRYIFSTDMNLFAVVSTSGAERMQQNIDASRRPLSREDLAWLENV